MRHLFKVSRWCFRFLLVEENSKVCLWDRKDLSGIKRLFRLLRQQLVMSEKKLKSAIKIHKGMLLNKHVSFRRCNKNVTFPTCRISAEIRDAVKFLLFLNLRSTWIYFRFTISLFTSPRRFNLLLNPRERSTSLVREWLKTADIAELPLFSYNKFSNLLLNVLPSSPPLSTTAVCGYFPIEHCSGKVQQLMARVNISELFLSRI